MRLAQPPLWVSALVLGACSSNPTPSSPVPPLAITSMAPAPNALAVETGASVRVTFNQAIDPASLTPATLTLTANGVPLPLGLSYDTGTHTVAATAPLLPDSTYRVTVTTAVRSVGGAVLGAPVQWTFTTRPWQAVTVDSRGDVGYENALAVDGDGGVHVAYENNSIAGVKYATCAADCAAAAQWDTVTVDSGGSVNVGMIGSLAVEGDGRLHITYLDLTLANLRYATCATMCLTIASWTTVAPDDSRKVWESPSLAVDQSGGVHVSYEGGATPSLKYATCTGTCTTFANWDTVTVDASGEVGLYSSLAVDGSDRVHVSYQDVTHADLRYATCAVACTSAGNWQVVTVDAPGAVGYFTSLGVDESGRVHVSYSDVNGDLKYATCAAACTTAAGWQEVTVPTPEPVQGPNIALAVDGSGRLHVTYTTGGSDLGYATCATACATAANWRAVLVDTAGDVGGGTSLAVDASGRVHVSYHDQTNADLRYAE
jgi:Bacterial Ig-like domain